MGSAATMLRSKLAQAVKPVASRWRDYMIAPILKAIEERSVTPAEPVFIPAPTPSPVEAVITEPAPAAVGPKLKTVRNVAELDEIVTRAALSETEEARVNMLCEYVMDDPSLTMPDDPFSPEYADAVMALYMRLTGKKVYNPAVDELIAFDPDQRAKRPSIYTYGSSHFLGMFLEAFGQILKAANVATGARILEFGPGDGQMALALARMGCDVTVIDIEQRYLDAIQKQAAAMDVSIKTIKGEFSDQIEGEFDCVLFFEAFHHVVDHQGLLRSLRKHVAPGGKIIFSGEPIIEAGDYWEPAVPFPWTVRMDALSLCAVRNCGWFELGFQESYFLELLKRTGWNSAKIKSPTNGRGTCYVATALDALSRG